MPNKFVIKKVPPYSDIVSWHLENTAGEVLIDNGKEYPDVSAAREDIRKIKKAVSAYTKIEDLTNE